MALSYTSWTKPKSIRQVAAHENAGLTVNSPTWSNLSAMLTQDGNFATTEWPNNNQQSYSYMAIGYNFGFTIQTDVIIRGFQSRTQRIASVYNFPSRGVTTSRLFVTDNATQITNLVTDNANIQYAFSDPVNNSDVLWTENSKLVQEIKTENDLHSNYYGTTIPISWNANKINSLEFGYGIAPIPLNTDSSPITCGIDYFEVRVIYEVIESIPLDGSMLLAF